MRLLICLSLVVLCIATKVTYEGHSVLQFVSTQSQLDNLVKKVPGFDLWKQRKHVDAWKIDAMMPREYISELEAMNMNYTVITEDVQKLIDDYANAPPSKLNKVDPFFDDFRTTEQTSAYMDELVKKYPNLLTRVNVGTTFEGRAIDGLQLRYGTSVKPKAMYFQAMAHAREWLTMPTALYILTKMLQDYTDGDQEIVRLVENLDWHIVPLVNVDGYTYTWTNSRLWRKNRRRNSGGSFGVDLNRNYGPNPPWCSSGSSTNPSSDTYCGTGPFSEPEDQAVRDYVAQYPQIKAGIDFHTYGALLLFPFQYTYDRVNPDDYALFTSLGGEIESTINGVHNQRYRNQQGSALYPHAGGFIDYNYLETDMLTWTVELRGSGFVVGKENIILSGEENYAGMKVLAKYVLDERE